MQPAEIGEYASMHGNAAGLRHFSKVTSMATLFHGARSQLFTYHLCDGLQSGRSTCNCIRTDVCTYMAILMRGRGRHVSVVSIAEFVAKIRTVKISSGASGGIFAKVCTSENFLLYGTVILCFKIIITVKSEYRPRLVWEGGGGGRAKRKAPLFCSCLIPPPTLPPH